MPRRWDDWRCYVCNRWHPQEAKRQKHLTPSGFVVAICESCARATYSKVRQGP